MFGLVKNLRTIASLPSKMLSALRLSFYPLFQLPTLPALTGVHLHGDTQVMDRQVHQQPTEVALVRAVKGLEIVASQVSHAAHPGLQLQAKDLTGPGYSPTLITPVGDIFAV